MFNRFRRAVAVAAAVLSVLTVTATAASAKTTEPQSPDSYGGNRVIETQNGYVLDNWGGDLSDGNDVHLYHQTGRPNNNEIWNIVPWDGNYRIELHASNNPKMCLDIPNGMLNTPGLKLWIWRCDNNKNAQQFKIVSYRGGYRIVGDWSGNTLKMCVAYDGESNYSWIRLEPCANTTKQLWFF